MSWEDLHKATASSLRGLVTRGEITVDQVVTSCLSRIELRDASVGAWEHVGADLAVAAARELDAGGHVGPLLGIPIGIKDVFDTVDMPTTYGSPLYRDHRPDRDAPIVSRLRAAGAVVLGKTVSTEFAYLSPPKTVNPIDRTRTAGGSSSGSAAAVRDHMVPVAIGTQTAGSTIRPAAFCGVVGFKPTYDAITMEGAMQLAGSLDTVGLFARSIDDVALIFSALAPAWKPRGHPSAFRFVFIESVPLRERFPAAFGRYPILKELLGRHGVAWEKWEVSEKYEHWLELHHSILAFEACQNFARYVDRRPDAIGVELRTLVEMGSAVKSVAYQKAQAACEEERLVLDRTLDDGDILLAPSAPGEAPLVAEGTGQPIFNSGWSMLHVPCLTVPVATGPAGLPLGIQLIARRGNDAALLAAGNFLSDLLQ